MNNRFSELLVRGLLVAAVTLLGLALLKPAWFHPAPPEVTLTEAPQRPAVAAGPVSYAAAVERAIPAVVNVYTTKVVAERLHPLLDDPLLRHFFGDLGGLRKRRQSSLGSGVIFSDQGYILTNHHVVEGAEEILVSLADGRDGEARLVGDDPDTDLAVLKVALDNLPTITLGSSEGLRVGDVVLAIGNPFGVGQTVTQGIVSAIGRNHLGLSAFENFIQTDAAINPGNSGGALINAYGDLVGINTAIYSKSGGSMGIGFAIPVALARQVFTQIVATGHPLRGWLGVELQDLTPALAETFGVEVGGGVLVAGVLRDGPAHRAGLRPGDVVTAIDGVAPRDGSELLARIARHPPGSTLHLDGVREGKAMRFEVTVGEQPGGTQ